MARNRTLREQTVPLERPKTLGTIIRPLPNEALVGLLQRADWANEVAAGTTATMVTRHDLGASSIG